MAGSKRGLGRDLFGVPDLTGSRGSGVGSWLVIGGPVAAGAVLLLMLFMVLIVVGGGGIAASAGEDQGAGGGDDVVCGLNITGADGERVAALRGEGLDLERIYMEAAQRPDAELGERGPSILAAIHKVESGFGDGREQPIYGPPTRYGRAMGPMQFLESTWATYKTDGNDDGRMDPQDPGDAIHASARLLSASGAPENWHDAIWAYNHAEWYVDDVLSIAQGYQEECETTAPASGPLDFKDTSGGWAGTQKFAMHAAELGEDNGCAILDDGDPSTPPGKRTPEHNDEVGGSATSDHLTTKTNAYAVDLGGCTMDFPGGEADQAAQDIAAWLGMGDHTGIVAVTRGKYRFQLIWQSGGHYDHVHLGVLRVG